MLESRAQLDRLISAAKAKPQFMAVDINNQPLGTFRTLNLAMQEIARTYAYKYKHNKTEVNLRADWVDNDHWNVSEQTTNEVLAYVREVIIAES